MQDAPRPPSTDGDAERQAPADAQPQEAQAGWVSLSRLWAVADSRSSSRGIHLASAIAWVSPCGCTGGGASWGLPWLGPNHEPRDPWPCGASQARGRIVRPMHTRRESERITVKATAAKAVDTLRLYPYALSDT